MNLRTSPSSLSKSNLLSLAKNMSRSSLLSKTTLQPSPSSQPSQPSQPPKTQSSNLLYSNIISNKERSRSVNAMMSSLLKNEPQNKEPSPQPNIKPISNISTPSTYSFIPIPRKPTTRYRNNNAPYDFKTTDNEHKDNDNINKADRINSRCSTNHTNGSGCRSKTMQMTYEEDDTSQEQFNLRRNSKHSNGNGYQCFSPISNVENHSIGNDVSDKDEVMNMINQCKGNRNYNGFNKSSSNIATPNRYIGNVCNNNSNNSNTNGILCGSYRYKHQQGIINPKVQPINIQLEDLIVLEEKLSHIYESVNNNNKLSISKLCTEWWTFYTYSSFNSKIENLFQDMKDTIHETSLLELISIITLYEIIKDPKTNNSTFNKFRNLISEIHQNFLIICDLILTKIQLLPLSTQNSFWFSKLQNIVLSKRTHRIYRGEHSPTLKKNNEYIITILRSIFRLYTSSTLIDISALHFYLRKINTTAFKTINDFFTKKINQDSCKNGDSLSFVINENTISQNVPVPYLQQRKDKRIFTLVLDLDETLISFRKEDAKKGILRLRPGLYKFLNEMKMIYEVIVFTTGTQEYADPILNAIEKQGKFFDKRLYRQHATIMDNVFVKDLSKLGRDISKVIIVDNMPHNFGLQKENGIFIKNFYGENGKDNALGDLIPILKAIASDDENDVRVELKKYENEIFTKITTDLKDDTE